MMLNRKLAVLMVASAALAAPLVVPASAKTNHHKGQQSNRVRYGSYLVPPPPAYMPTILPELKTAENTESAEPPKPVNPYKKYVYTKQGHEEPAPVQPNKYVTYWNNKS